jgi:signal peptidase II
LKTASALKDQNNIVVDQDLSRLRRWAVLLGTAGFIFALDQLAKAWVVAHLDLGESRALLSDFLGITYTTNRGAAFSFLPQAGNVFLAIQLIFVVGALIYYPRLVGPRWLDRIGLGLVIGGAAGNALDRIRLGYVVDFVHIEIESVISNVSNFADHAIVLGVILLVMSEWWRGRKNALNDESAAND